MSEKKRKHKVLIILLVIVLIIISAFAGLFLYSKIDRKEPLSVLPHDYSVYLHTDSAWNAVEPLLDLKAIDMFFSTPELTSCRGIFMQLRAAQWRNNRILSKIASKPVDLALYKDDNPESKYNILLCVDLGGLSSITRFSSVYLSKLNIQNLYEGDDCYIYDNKGTEYYIRPYKNLLLASDSHELLNSAFQEDYNNYSKEELAVLNKKSPEPIKIVANLRKLSGKLFEGEGIVPELAKAFPQNGLCAISVSLTDESFRLNASIPLEAVEDENYSLSSIFERRSSTPSIISRFRENVQYYTIINAGSLQQLKDAFFPIIVKDSEGSWKKYNSVSKTLLSLSIEELLFSWTGDEVVIFGIEGKNDPVFAIQIKDEKKRQQVFEKFLSSMLIKDNSSLLLDGVRIPRLELPTFLEGLLSLFEVRLPNPYYLIQDGFIYFSENAENLSEIHKGEKHLPKIASDANWNAVSKGLSTDAALSLYYNLDRSAPFFLRSKANLSNLISLYSIGRTDLCIKNSELIIQLSAISKSKEDSLHVPGFPITLEGRVDGKLAAENNNPKAKSNALYWVENQKTICSMELPSTNINRREMGDAVFICPLANANEEDAKKGVLWAVTVHGEAYLLTRKLEVVSGFPVFLSEEVEVEPVAHEDGVFVFTENSNMLFVDTRANVTSTALDIDGLLKSTPSIKEDFSGRTFVGYYDKGFLGKLGVLCSNDKKQSDNEEMQSFSLEVSGIAYGSPAFLVNKKGEMPYVGFVTQTGDFYLWNLNNDESTIIQLEGNYKCPVVCLGNCFVAISTEGLISRISLSGEVLEMKIPNVTCNDAFVTVNDNSLYVCPDGNVIYGFDENLELLVPFPVTGWGRPAFADVNGDKTLDFFALSVDNKLHAVKMR